VKEAWSVEVAACRIELFDAGETDENDEPAGSSFPGEPSCTRSAWGRG
jgi:hypothetical protein